GLFLVVERGGICALFGGGQHGAAGGVVAVGGLQIVGLGGLVLCHTSHLERVANQCSGHRYATGGEEALTIASCHLNERPPHRFPQGGDGSRSAAAQCCFDLRPDLFDRIEVRRIRRQEPHRCSPRLDGLLHSRGLVARQVVHGNDVSRFQFRSQDL